LFSPGATEGLSYQAEHTRAAVVEKFKLLPREIEFLDHLGRFLLEKEIADKMAISIPLTKKLTRRICRKMSVRSRTELIVLWKTILGGLEGKYYFNPGRLIGGS
jgi:DNA-binding CsgD family transcriptional regulator